MIPRERLAEKIHWPIIIWMAGFVNVGAMLPQLWQIITTKNVEGLALGMFVTYFFIQVAFALDGHFKRNKVFLVCLGLSAIISAAIIVLIVKIRYFS